MGNYRLMGKLLLVLLWAVAIGHAGSVTIPAGTQITVRMTDTIDSEKSYIGETFRASMEDVLRVGGQIVVPRGAEAIGRLVAVEQAGRFRGRSMVAVELTALNFDGLSLAVQTSAYQEVGSSSGKETAKLAGGGGLLGSILGAITGGKKGSLIGATMGAAGGAIMQTVRGSEQVRIPAESLVIFTLQSPVSVDTGF
ncbi:MAG: hypothetical protein HY648_12785 [Acidobacteria bacterium]|nr:hypothetical protein [Acidobacteriota bacterium]